MRPVKARTPSAVLVLALAAGFATAASATNSTINATNRWAWGAGAGWIDCRADPSNGAVIGEYVCSGYFYSPTLGWMHLGSGAPTNGIRYCNAATNDYGVNHDGEGNLRGFAWCPSAGWIAFEDVGAPYVDLHTGCVTGAVWSASCGWINFTNVYYFLQSDRMDTGPDTDGDTIPDMWERDQAGSNNLTLLTRTGDYDLDGMLDPEEYMAGTDPFKSSSLLEILSFWPISTTDVGLAWASRPTRLYGIDQAGSLTSPASWTDSGLGLMVPDNPTNTARTFSIAAPTQRFYRVKAALPMSD